MEDRDIKQSGETDTSRNESGEGDRRDKQPNGDSAHADHQWPDCPAAEGIDELVRPSRELVTQTFDWIPALSVLCHKTRLDNSAVRCDTSADLALLSFKGNADGANSGMCPDDGSHGRDDERLAGFDLLE